MAATSRAKKVRSEGHSVTTTITVSRYSANIAVARLPWLRVKCAAAAAAGMGLDVDRTANTSFWLARWSKTA